MLVVLCLRSRTRFAAYLSQSMHRVPHSHRGSSATFPIPVPLGRPFGMSPKGLSSAKRRRLHRLRALHCLVMALNYWNSGGDFSDLDLIHRPLKPHHRSIHKRLWAFLLSDGQFPAVNIVRAGRKFPQLVARISEISQHVTVSGICSSPYSRDFEGCSIPMDNSRFMELEPYRKADPDRIKITGDGHCDVTDLLPDQLTMAYREPALLANGLVAPHGCFPTMTETPEQIAGLARMWDRNGLLMVHDYDIPTHYPEEQVRIFGAVKDESRDRQIGDRRGKNYAEDKVSGPSSQLPAASDLCDLLVDLRSQRISLSITDRKDFYHFIYVTKAKAIANTLGPGLDPSLLEGTDGLKLFLLNKEKKVRRSRIEVGDNLGAHDFRAPRSPSKVFAAFKSVLQGDHAGVEIACAAHSQLLRNAGLLNEEEVVLGSRPWRHPSNMQGLVIDDYFSISVHEKGENKTCDTENFDAAQKIYKKSGLLGSPDKDVRGAPSGKVIGGYVNGARQSVEQGMTTVGSPPEKRYGLSWLSLQVTQLNYVSDALMLSLLGGWVSIAMFRRCFMGLFNEVHHLVDISRFNPNDPKLLALPRSTAEELVLAAVLVPLFQTDVAVGFEDFIYATDASEERGAICRAPLDKQFQEVLARVCKTKGAYSRLQRQEERWLQDLGVVEVVVERDEPQFPKPSRSLAFRYQFIEIFAGAAVVTEHAAKLGLVVGPPIELSISEELNVKLPHVLSWLTYMLVEGLLDSCMVEPPCTTFSIMRSPPLRGKKAPFGYNVMDPQTSDGNVLAHRGFQVLSIGGDRGCPCLLETPNSSMLKNLPSWRNLAARRHFRVTRTDSCAFGSPHLKAFKFLHVNLRLVHSTRRCTCTGKHVKVEGAYTKSSATYVPLLAEALAKDFHLAILAKKKREEVEDQIEVVGLENQAVNHLATTLPWEVHKSWKFKRSSHINLLEISSVLGLVEDLLRRGQSIRVVSLIDSYVSRGALGKGRSASRAISCLFRRIGSSLAAGGIYLTTPFCPTRLNIADDPTRNHPLRPPQRSFGDWTRSSFMDLASLPGLKRCASNWARVVLRLTDFALVPPMRSLPHRRIPIYLDFDQTLGYPGEGPTPATFHLPIFVDFVLVSIILLFSPSHFILPNWILLSRSHRSSLSSCLLVLSFVLSGALSCNAMETGPRNAADFTRVTNRRTAGPLPEGRLVLEVTAFQRDRLLRNFYDWCSAEGYEIHLWLGDTRNFLEEINLVLIRFGRRLYEWGRPLNHFVETINGLTSLRPALRRALQAPWDMAFNWSKMEPNVHHIAVPFQIIMAMITVSLMWGWLPLAGGLAIMWGALLRPGEFISAIRQQLTLPSDLEHTTTFGILSILEPKTRFSAARHQAARLDLPDLLEVVELAFAELGPFQRLWPFSGQTLRARFRNILLALNLPVVKTDGIKPLDLGSLRAGGATWLLQTTESGELCRRRGRWASQKVMDLYIQEVSSLQYLSRIPVDAKSRVLHFARALPGTIRKCQHFYHCKIDPKIWYILFQQQPSK